MSILNNLRNILNKNSIVRKLFVKLISPFTLPILTLLKYISIKEFKRKKIVSLWRKMNPKNILYYENGIGFNISTKKNSMSKSLVLQEHSETNETKFLKKIIDTGQVVIDIGANMGWYSIHFSKWVGGSGKIFAFEPVPEIHEELRSNIKLNFCQNIKVFNCALGNKNESILFNVSNFEGGSGASSENLKFGKEIKVTKRKLDDVMSEQNINNIDFLKIDIEGGELNMLKGAEKIIEKYKPKIFLEIVDIHCDRFGYLPEDVFNFLYNKNYNGLYIGNEHSKKLNDLNINELEKPNMKNLKNGNYYFY
tara:strand:- start:461 stop:1384 length:924 start_codon:yes stop_codon:yes gene_type:complete